MSEEHDDPIIRAAERARQRHGHDNPAMWSPPAAGKSSRPKYWKPEDLRVLVAVLSLLAVAVGLWFVFGTGEDDIANMQGTVFGTGLFTGGFVMFLRALLPHR